MGMSSLKNPVPPYEQDSSPDFRLAELPAGQSLEAGKDLH